MQRQGRTFSPDQNAELGFVLTIFHRIGLTCRIRSAGHKLTTTRTSAREETMRHPLLAVAITASAMTFPGAALAQAPAPALTGLVSSTEEAAMEGVLVSATKT